MKENTNDWNLLRLSNPEEYTKLSREAIKKKLEKIIPTLRDLQGSLDLRMNEFPKYAKSLSLDCNKFRDLQLEKYYENIETKKKLTDDFYNRYGFVHVDILLSQINDCEESDKWKLLNLLARSNRNHFAEISKVKNKLSNYTNLPKNVIDQFPLLKYLPIQNPIIGLEMMDFLLDKSPENIFRYWYYFLILDSNIFSNRTFCNGIKEKFGLETYDYCVIKFIYEGLKKNSKKKFIEQIIEDNTNNYKKVLHQEKLQKKLWRICNGELKFPQLYFWILLFLNRDFIEFEKLFKNFCSQSTIKTVGSILIAMYQIRPDLVNSYEFQRFIAEKYTSKNLKESFEKYIYSTVKQYSELKLLKIICKKIEFEALAREQKQINLKTNLNSFNSNIENSILEDEDKESKKEGYILLDKLVAWVNSNKKVLQAISKKNIERSNINNHNLKGLKIIISRLLNIIICNPNFIETKGFIAHYLLNINNPKLIEILTSKVIVKVIEEMKQSISIEDYITLLNFSKLLYNPLSYIRPDPNLNGFISWFNKSTKMNIFAPTKKNANNIILKTFKFSVSHPEIVISQDFYEELLKKIQYPDLLVSFINDYVLESISDIRTYITFEEYEIIMKFFYSIIEKAQNNDKDFISKEDNVFSNGNSLIMQLEIQNNESVEELEDSIDKEEIYISNEEKAVSFENEEPKLKIAEVLEREIRPIFIKEKLESFYPSSKNQKTGKKDYITEHKKKIEVGEIGEKMVLIAEKQRLSSEGAPETLISRIKRVAEEKDGLGYDILSYNIDSSPRYIEVKTTSLSPSNFYFELTSNELSISKKYAENYYLYIVIDILSPNPRIKVIRNPFGDNSSMKLVPIKYRVNLRLIDESEDF